MNEQARDRLLKLAQRARPGGIAASVDGEVQVAGAVASDDRFEIGSVTKVFNGQLLHVLAAEGVVRLDEPARECLGPGWRLDDRITLERLATHRSGLPRTPRRAWRSFRADGDDPWRAFSVEDLRGSLPPLLPRPRWFRYSNFGAALLGAALAARAGTPWRELVRQLILEPLELHDTGFEELPVAQPHTRRGRPTPPWTVDAMDPAGALRSTVGDLARFLAAAAESPSWMEDEGVRWHNGGTGGSSAFVSLDPPVILLANAAIAQRLTALGLRLARRE